MKASKHDGRCIAHRLENFLLLTYRTTLHATTNSTPAALFLGQDIRTRFDLLKPDLEGNVSKKQAEQIIHHDHHAKERQFQIKDKVMVKNFCSDPTWIPGVIIQKLAPLTYLVEVQGGLKWKRHIDHIKSLGSKKVSEPNNSENTDTDQESSDYHPPTPEQTMPELNQEQGTPRYPSRNRQPPQRYM